MGGIFASEERPEVPGWGYTRVNSLPPLTRGQRRADAQNLLQSLSIYALGLARSTPARDATLTTHQFTANGHQYW